MSSWTLAQVTLTCCVVCVAGTTPARAVSPARPPIVVQRVDRQSLCVTNGEVSTLPDGRLAVESPSSRAVVRLPTAQTVEIRFRYLGPTRNSKPLASGELRHQIGIKLRAHDTCNLVYAMWHIAPDARLAVSVKRNPDKHTHAECGAAGYVNIKPWRAVELPAVQPNEPHVLRAELNGQEVTLSADGQVVWEGSLGARIADLNGPVGLRTDNARFEFEYFAAVADPGTATNPPVRCETSPAD
jgi:hypothetical protein